jgi:hypothetical protein
MNQLKRKKKVQDNFSSLICKKGMHYLLSFVLRYGRERTNSTWATLGLTFKPRVCVYRVKGFLGLERGFAGLGRRLSLVLPEALL